MVRQNKFVIDNVINANNQAKTVLKTNENAPYFHEPVSLTIAVIAAMHGKYSRTKTMKANALAGVNGVFPVINEGV